MGRELVPGGEGGEVLAQVPCIRGRQGEERGTGYTRPKGQRREGGGGGVRGLGASVDFLCLILLGAEAPLGQQRG